MRGLRVALGVVAVLGSLLAVGIQPVYADEVSAADVSALKEENKVLRQEVQAMRRDLEVLKAERETRARAGLAQGTAGLTERVEALETATQSTQEEQDSLLKQLDDKVDLHLYTTFDMYSFEDKDFAFDARHVELLADVHPFDRLSAFLQLRLERLATIDDDDEFRQGDIETHQGWVEYAVNDYFIPRIGLVLVPFGKYNQEHFEPFQELALRPLSHLRVVPSTWTEAGVGFRGKADLGERFFSGTWLRELGIDYKLFVVNGLSNDIRDHRGLRDARGSWQRDNNNNKGTVGRLGILPIPSLELGVSSYLGEYDPLGHQINGLDVDGKFAHGPFDLLGEYAVFDLHEGGFRGDTSTNPISTTAVSVPESLRGGYLEANYRFWFDCLNDTFLGRTFKSPTFTASVRFDHVAINDDGDAGDGPNKEQRWTFGLNYRPVPTWAFKFNYVVWNDSKNEFLDPTGTGGQDGFVASVATAF